MTYSLSIREIDTGFRKNWWSNFTISTREEHFGPGLHFTTGAWMNFRADTLKKYNAWYDGTDVHFESEKDAMLFLLRYS